MLKGSLLASSNIHYVRGVAHWAKVIGPPRLITGEFADGVSKEWTIDVSLDKEGVALFNELGVASRIRTPKEGDLREPFHTFKQRDTKQDGTANEPIRIVDANGQPWPEGKLIGNGSIVDVKFAFKPGLGKKKAGVYIRAIRVLELVPYVAKDFAPLSADDKYFEAGGDETVGSAEAPDFKRDFDVAEDEELNDDIPGA